ncbi:2-succinyl-6-hydroxy-2,4-cyclohexadiene-1-carboxylate synthase [Shewanella sp. WXL01]|uniref:2-succinyl-6-hydroxy-2, 4-cyclohexadiene-1-carboxylate synthase n=1 Tax=Shewanella sp. WXL01 TaxID=2709721 RepID=UPI0032AF8BFC
MSIIDTASSGMVRVSRFGELHLPKLVLVHGFLGAKEDWLACMPILSQQFHCICVDLPGHGQSRAQLPTPGLEAAAQAIIATLSSLQCHQFHLVGYSLGGRIALHIAKLFPHKLLSLTLESAHPGLTDDKQRDERLNADKQWAEKLQRLPIVQFLQLWYQRGVFSDLTEDEVAKLIAKRSNNNNQALLNCYLATSLGHQQDCRNVISQLKQPCHIIVGQHDQKFSKLAKQWQTEQPLNVISVEHAGHNIHSLQPQLFSQQLLKLLNK